MNEGQLVIAVAVLGLVIIRRFAGSPVGAKSMILPLALMTYGVLQIHGHVNAMDLVLLAAEAVVSLIGGLARGVTIKLFVRDGHLWQRYTPLTLLVWIIMIAARVGFGAAGHVMGASISSVATVMIAFGFSIFIESLVVSRRAALTGAPILPRQSRSGRRTVGTF